MKENEKFAFEENYCVIHFILENFWIFIHSSSVLEKPTIFLVQIRNICLVTILLYLVILCCIYYIHGICIHLKNVYMCTQEREYIYDMTDMAD